MWKLLKYEFRRARTSLLTVLGVIAVLEMYFLISLGVDHMELRWALTIWSTSSLRRC